MPPRHAAYSAAAAPVRPGQEADLPLCLALDEGYSTGRIWQLGGGPPGLPASPDDEWLGGHFRPLRLPRPHTIPGGVARRAPWHHADALFVVGPRPPPPAPEPDEPAEEADPSGSADFASRITHHAEVWGYVLLAHDPAGLGVWLRALVVGPAHRRQGLGTRLLGAARQWAGHAAPGVGGRPTLLVALAPQNDPAIAFCRRAGLGFCGYSDLTAWGGEVQLLFGGAS